VGDECHDSQRTERLGEEAAAYQGKGEHELEQGHLARAGERRSPAVSLGGGSHLADREQRAGCAIERKEPMLGLRPRRFFKNRLWAHQTVYSPCPMHNGQHTVAVR
jgi:hypothetical protein